MILILTPDIDTEGEAYKSLMARLSRLPNIRVSVHREQGAEHCLTEVYLIGNTASISVGEMKALPGVERAMRVSEEYRVIGRHKDDGRPTHFDYKGVRFGQDTLNVFAGLCAVDEPRSVELMMRKTMSRPSRCRTTEARKRPKSVA